MRVSAGLALALVFALLGPGLALSHPASGIAVDPSGRVYFLDTGQGVLRIEDDGTLAPRPGPAWHWMAMDTGDRFGAARFPSIPSGAIAAAGSSPTLILSSDVPVAMDRDGDLYYPLLNGQKRVQIMRLTPAGRGAVLATLPAASDDGRPLRWLNGIAVGPDDAVYFTVSAAVMKASADGSVSTVARVSLSDCAPVPGTADEPKPYLRGLDAAAGGVLYVAASGCGCTIMVKPDGSVTPLLRAESPWSPTGVAVHGTDLYILEYLHSPGDDRRAWLPRVRKWSPGGTVTTLAAVPHR